MAFSIAQNTFQTNGISKQFASNVTNGNIILVLLTGGATLASVTVSDTAGNSYTAATNQANGSNSAWARFYYAYNIKGGGTKPTVTATAGADINIIEIAGVGGGTSNPYDQDAGNNPASTTTPALASSLTPNKANSIFISGIVAVTATTDTPGDTPIDNQSNSGSAVQPFCSQYVVQTTAIAHNPGWTLGSAKTVAVVAIIFKQVFASSALFFSYL